MIFHWDRWSHSYRQMLKVVFFDLWKKKMLNHQKGNVGNENESRLARAPVWNERLSRVPRALLSIEGHQVATATATATKERVLCLIQHISSLFFLMIHSSHGIGGHPMIELTYFEFQELYNCNYRQWLLRYWTPEEAEKIIERYWENMSDGELQRIQIGDYDQSTHGVDYSLVFCFCSYFVLFCLFQQKQVFI